jgi:hypothetical protein
MFSCAKKAPPPDPTPAPNQAPTIAAAVVTAPPPAYAPPENEENPPSLRGKTVLHVGDSMVGGSWGLTRGLEVKLEAEGAKIVRHTKVSETLASMDKDSTLADLLEKNEPDIVILTLGTNNTDVPHPEVYAKHVANIVQRIAPRECWWIGPPKDAPVNAVIRENVASCKFFDSSKLELERTKDGIHPTDRGGAMWADKFWVAFRAPRSGSLPDVRH